MANVSSNAGEPITAAITPAVVQGPASDFYAFYITPNAQLGLTTWIGGKWVAGPAVNGSIPPLYLGSVLQPLQACVGRDCVYGIYPCGTGGLQVVFGTGAVLAHVTPPYQLQSDTVNSYCAFAGSGPTLVVNKQTAGGSNALVMATVSPSGLEWITQSPSSIPAPLAKSPVATVEFAGERHILFEGTLRDGTTTVYDLVDPLGPNQYKSSRVVSLGSSAMGLAYFVYNQFLFAVITSVDGHLHVMYYNTQGTDPAWMFVVMLTATGAGNVGAPLATTPAAVGCMPGGVFVCYTDAGNDIQCAYFLPSTFRWACLQLTGAGSKVHPGAPKPLSAMAVTPFLQSTLHICYGAAPAPSGGYGIIEDLFYRYPGWSRQFIFPSPGAPGP